MKNLAQTRNSLIYNVCKNIPVPFLRINFLQNLEQHGPRVQKRSMYLQKGIRNKLKTSFSKKQPEPRNTALDTTRESKRKEQTLVLISQ